jgi:single-strand DNA-binding protein
MINRVVLTGRLTRNVELKKTSNGKSFAKLTLAVDRARKSEGQPDADFINCIAWNRRAETMYQYLRKGSLIGIDGKLNTGSYKKDGQTIYTTDVIVDDFTFLESKNKENNTYAEPTTEPNIDLSDVDEYF